MSLSDDLIAGICHGRKAALISSLGRTVLGSDILTIGRDADNRLVIRDPTV